MTFSFKELVKDANFSNWLDGQFLESVIMRDFDRKLFFSSVDDVVHVTHYMADLTSDYHIKYYPCIPLKIEKNALCREGINSYINTWFLIVMIHSEGCE